MARGVGVLLLALAVGLAAPVRTAGQRAVPGTISPGQDASQQATRTGSVTGTITDRSTGRPLAGVQVLVAGTSQAALSNEQGRYLIDGIAPGAAAIQARLVGYGAASVEANVAPGETSTVDLELTQAPSAPEQVVVGGEGNGGNTLLLTLLSTFFPLLGVFLGLELASRRGSIAPDGLPLATLLGGLTAGLLAGNAAGFLVFWALRGNPMSLVDEAGSWWLMCASALWLSVRHGPGSRERTLVRAVWGGMLGAAAWIVLNVAGYFLLGLLDAERSTELFGWSWRPVVSRDVWYDLLVGAGLGYVVAVWAVPPRRRTKVAELTESPESDPRGVTSASQGWAGSLDGRIHISYRRSDAAVQQLVAELYDQLAQAFGRDAVAQKQIPAGVVWEKALMDQVADASWLLVVIGPGWLDPDEEGPRLHRPDDFVRREIEIALRSGVQVVPVLAAGAHIPSVSDLPESLRGLAERHAFALREGQGFGDDVDKLIRSIAASQAS